MSGLKYTFAGQELTLSARVKHKYVRRVQNIMTEWMMNNLDMKTLMESGDGGEASMSTLLQNAIMADPQMALKIQDLENSMILDQTIILASGIEHSVLLELKEEAYEDEYIELYEKCRELLGGNANDFFEVYRIGSTSHRNKRMTMKKNQSETIPQV